MDQESLRKLGLDRRLLQRRGWIDSEELERRLAELPDVSGKARRGDEGEASGAGAAGSPEERA